MIYLDNSATTRPMAEVIETVREYMANGYFNPAGVYRPAVEVDRQVSEARERLARALGVLPEEVIYTSGGTESNNMAISGVLTAKRHGKLRVITTQGEHASVYEMYKSIEMSGHDVVYLGLNCEGAIDPNQLLGEMTDSTVLVSIMHVNNETGAVNDIDSCYRIIRSVNPGALLHVDGVQAFLKVGRVQSDLYSISGHKFHGPKGVGALYIRKNIRFAGGQMGGGQEQGIRSGTLNVPGIMGMDSAVTSYIANRELYITSLRACKLRLAKNILSLSDTMINGPQPEAGAPHILNASFFGVRGEVLLHALEERGVYVSTGAACSAKKKGKNRILAAMGIIGERAEGAVRFSLCPFNTLEQMDEVAQHVKECLTMLRRYQRR